jgi:hypothetical protein
MKFLILISLIALLSGCMAHQQNQVKAYYAQAEKRELAAWDNAWQKSNEECGEYNDENPMPRKKAREYGKCFEKIVRELVLPNAINQTTLNRYLVDIEKVNIDYAKGKLDRDSANLNIKEAWLDYTERLSGAYLADINRAYQADQITAQRTQQALDNFHQEMQRQEMINAIAAGNMRQNTPMLSMNTTRCSVWRDTITCTEY